MRPDLGQTYCESERPPQESKLRNHMLFDPHVGVGCRSNGKHPRGIDDAGAFGPSSSDTILHEFLRHGWRGHLNANVLQGAIAKNVTFSEHLLPRRWRHPPVAWNLSKCRLVS